MPSPSAMAVWVSDRSMRRRRMRGPAKIFCSAIADLDRFGHVAGRQCQQSRDRQIKSCKARFGKDMRETESTSSCRVLRPTRGSKPLVALHDGTNLLTALRHGRLNQAKERQQAKSRARQITARHGELPVFSAKQTHDPRYRAHCGDQQSKLGERFHSGTHDLQILQFDNAACQTRHRFSFIFTAFASANWHFSSLLVNEVIAEGATQSSSRTSS